MNSAKRYLLIALSFAICMTIFAAFAPRIAHAITATLVQVVNTSANPVPTADSALRFFATVCNVSGATSAAANYCTDTAHSFTVPTVTSTGAGVRRLVVDNVSGFCANFNNPTVQLKMIDLRAGLPPDNVSNGDPVAEHDVPIGPPFSYVGAADAGFPFTNTPESDYSFGQTANFALNAGETVAVGVRSFWPGDGPIDRVCSIRIDGYLVTQ
jgi:hypothetical protein